MKNRWDQRLARPDAKRIYNEALFTRVAARYDAAAACLSWGRDARWKQILISQLPDVEAPRCVDLACGTGDLTVLLRDRYPHGSIVGVDLTWPMLMRAQRREASGPIAWCRQDLNDLGLRSDSVDIVTGSYALRNAPDLDRTLAEIHRILRLNGTAVFLDFSKPVHRWGQRFALWVLHLWGCLWGLLLHGRPEVYAYIAASLRRFPDRTDLRARLRKHGFHLRKHRRFFLGILELLVLHKNHAL